MTHESDARRKLRRLSKPIALILTGALALLVLFEAAAIGAILFLLDGDGDWRGVVGFAEAGVTLLIVGIDDPVRGGVGLETLDFARRSAVAALALACGAGTVLAVFHLRQLFALYARGAVFEADNIRHIKHFGLWLVLTAIAINLSARLFAVVTGTPAEGTANAALALVYGAMTYAVARAMELGREADLELREYV